MPAAAIIEILLLANRIAPPVLMAVMALVDQIKGEDETAEEIDAELAEILERLRARNEAIQNA